MRERRFGSGFDRNVFFAGHFFSPVIPTTRQRIGRKRREQLLRLNHANKILLVTFFLHRLPHLHQARCVARP